jgi:MFS family permease
VPAPIPRAGLLVLAAVGLAQVLVTLDYFSLTVAIPQMADDLDVSTTDIQWALTGYLISFAALMVAGGRVGDIVGRKRTLLAGVVIFGGASLLCGLAYDEYMLVACRVLQGAGAAVLFPTSMAVVGNSFDDETRPRAIGVVVLVSMAGTALGPLVGGVLTDVLDWRWVFLVNVPLAAIAAAMIMVFVRESRDECVTRHVDYRGVVTLSGAIVAVTLAIDRGPAWAESEPAALAGCLAAAVVLLVAFVALERRVESPLVDLPTFRSPAFVMVTVSGVLSNFLWALSVFVATVWLQDVKGFSPLESGLSFLRCRPGWRSAGPCRGASWPVTTWGR